MLSPSRSQFSQSIFGKAKSPIVRIRVYLVLVASEISLCCNMLLLSSLFLDLYITPTNNFSFSLTLTNTFFCWFNPGDNISIQMCCRSGLELPVAPVSHRICIFFTDIFFNICTEHIVLPPLHRSGVLILSFSLICF